jgi:membrane dipeptidase
MAGVNVVSLNVGFAHMTWAEHINVLSFMRQWIALRPDRYRLVATVEDIYLSKADGRLGIVFDVEGMCPVLESPSRVQTFYELGVRWMLIAYNRNNAAGGGCLDLDGGLTECGREIIAEMERVGMVLCLSHTGRRTAAEALEYSTNPVFFSHSNPYGDHAHPRNVADDLMLMCAAKGGVVGLSGIGLLLGASTQLLERLMRQIRYAIDLVGPEHVGLALDYAFDQAEVIDAIRSKPELFPPGFQTLDTFPMIAPESFPAVADGLARDNLSDAQIRAVLGENWLRVAKRVWK